MKGPEPTPLSMNRNAAPASRDTVKVKTVDQHRTLKELPVRTVFRSVAQNLL